MSKERYNEIIDEVYQEYDELFDSYHPPFSAPYPTRLTKEELVEEIKKGGHDELGVTIEERELSLEERLCIADKFNPLIREDCLTKTHHPDEIEEFKLKYRHEWLDSLGPNVVPQRKEIKVTYNNETITVYE